VKDELFSAASPSGEGRTKGPLRKIESYLYLSTRALFSIKGENVSEQKAKKGVTLFSAKRKRGGLSLSGGKKRDGPSRQPPPPSQGGRREELEVQPKERSLPLFLSGRRGRFLPS